MTVWGWVLIWVLLVIGALLVFALIGWHLFKKVKGVLAQAGESGVVFEAFSQAMDDIEERAYQPVHAVVATQEEKQQWRHTRRVNRIKRRKRKDLRRKKTLRRWSKMPF